jgi:hypothetical protein
MHKVLQSTDWSFLVAGEITQICIGFNDVQIHLVRGRGRDVESVSITIECEFEHRRAEELLSNHEETHLRATTLVSLLGKKVDNVRADAEDALTIGFDGDETVKIIVDESPYEAFNIKGPQGLIVV